MPRRGRAAPPTPMVQKQFADKSKLSADEVYKWLQSEHGRLTDNMEVIDPVEQQRTKAVHKLVHNFMLGCVIIS